MGLLSVIYFINVCLELIGMGLYVLNNFPYHAFSEIILLFWGVQFFQRKCGEINELVRHKKEQNQILGLTRQPWTSHLLAVIPADDEEIVKNHTVYGTLI